MAGAVGGRISVTYDEAAFDDLNSPSGPVGRYLTTVLQAITQEAKRLAPTSPDGSNGRPSGYLRSAIGWSLAVENGVLVGRVSTPATTPDGKPYGLFQEVGWTTTSGRPGKFTPHLRPALEKFK